VRSQRLVRWRACAPLTLWHSSRSRRRAAHSPGRRASGGRCRRPFLWSIGGGGGCGIKRARGAGATSTSREMHLSLELVAPCWANFVIASTAQTARHLSPHIHHPSLCMTILSTRPLLSCSPSLNTTTHSPTDRNSADTMPASAPASPSPSSDASPTPTDSHSA